MNKKVVLLLIVFAMGLLGLFSLFGSRTKKSETVRKDFGPFTIEMEIRTEKHFNYNTGKMGRNSYSSYRILYKGNPVSYPESFESNTGYPVLWKAYTMPDAPVPAILAGSQNLFLITEEGGQSKVQLVGTKQSGFATWQWLDAINGQPGPKQEVYLSPDRAGVPVLEGGRYLLLNGNIVLDLTDLSMVTFSRFGPQLQNFYATNPVAFSPDQKQIVFVGNRNAEGIRFDYALLSYDYRSGESYPVPFDQSDFRIRGEHDIDQTWFNTYFEWGQLEDGMILRKKELDQLPPWQGHFPESGDSYDLQPVSREMMNQLASFIREELQIPESEFQVISNERINFSYQDIPYSVGYFDNIQTAYLMKDSYSADPVQSKAFIQRVGNAFNDALKSGKYGEYFTRF